MCQHCCVVWVTPALRESRRSDSAQRFSHFAEIGAAVPAPYAFACRGDTTRACQRRRDGSPSERARLVDCSAGGCLLGGCGELLSWWLGFEQRVASERDLQLSGLLLQLRSQTCNLAMQESARGRQKCQRTESVLESLLLCSPSAAASSRAGDCAHRTWSGGCSRPAASSWRSAPRK